MTWPHSTAFNLLRIFSPLEISSIKIWPKCSLRLPSASQKRACLSSVRAPKPLRAKNVVKKPSKQKNNKTIKESDTLEHETTVWPGSYTCAQPYHPGSGSHILVLGGRAPLGQHQESRRLDGARGVASRSGLVRPHQHAYGIVVGQKMGLGECSQQFPCVV